MSDIKYYALETNEEPPMEFIVIRHVGGEPEFVTSYINSSYLSYENGVLLKMHERNDILRAENARLQELVDYMAPIALYEASEQERDRMRELGLEGV